MVVSDPSPTHFLGYLEQIRQDEQHFRLSGTRKMHEEVWDWNGDGKGKDGLLQIPVNTGVAICVRGNRCGRDLIVLLPA